VSGSKGRRLARIVLTQDNIRELIRDEIRKVDPPPSRVWTLLNSPFGVFLISSVLLSGLGALYTNRLALIAEDRDKRDQISKYATEFIYRLSKLQKERDFLAKNKNDNGQSVALAVVRIVRGEELTINQGTIDFVPSLPEFKNTNLIVVVNRLTRLGIADVSNKTWKAVNNIEIKGEAYDEVSFDTFDEDLAVLRQYRKTLIDAGYR
jgi:hypothetical protein